MKQAVHLLGALSLTLAGIGISAKLPAEELALRGVTFQAKSVPFVALFDRWATETNARCRGQISIRVFGPHVVPSARQWHALKTGEVDLYFGPANYYRGALPEADVFNLAHKNPAEQRRNGAWAKLNALHNAAMNAWYLTSLGHGVQFFVYTAKKATGGRFEGLRLRAVPLYSEFLRSLGAVSRYMPASDVEAALAEGAIDGYSWPLWSAGLGWEKHIKYRYGPGFLNAASPVLVNLDRWRSLSDSQRQCLTQMAVWAESELPVWQAEEDARQQDALVRAGIEYLDLGAGFAQQAEDIYWAMLERARPDFVREIRPLLVP